MSLSALVLGHFGLVLLAVTNAVGLSLIAMAILRPSRENVATIRRHTKFLLVAAAVIQAAVVFSAFRVVSDGDSLVGEVAHLRDQVATLRDEMKQHHMEFSADRDHLASLAVDSMSGELRLTNAHEDLKRQVELMQFKIQSLHPDQPAHRDDQPKESTLNDISNPNEQGKDTSDLNEQVKNKKIRMLPAISDLMKTVQAQANKVKHIDLIKALQVQADKVKHMETSFFKKTQSWSWKPFTKLRWA